MKRITLLLSMVFLLCFSGIAQKNIKGGSSLASKKKSTEKNFTHVVKQTNTPNVQPQDMMTLSGYMSESFEGTFPPAGWTKQDPDGGTGWAQMANGTSPIPGFGGGTQTVPPGGGNYVAYCEFSTGGASSDDQWLITPQFSVVSGDSVGFDLWWFGSYEDSLFVLLSTATNATTDFTTTLLQVDTVNLSPMSTWKHYSIDLTPYAGQAIYVAFREKISNNVAMGAYFALDLVTLGIQPANDVAAQSIDVPAINAPGTISPKATVVNIGTDTETFNVTMKITGGYTSTKTVTLLPSDSSRQVTFDNWSAVQGNDTITVFTQLAGDANTSNDTLSEDVSVFLDVEALTIDVPTPIGPGSMNPKATIMNNGGTATNFNVTMTITGGYSSTKTVASLMTDSTIQITFNPWNATIGTDTITVFTQLAGDTITYNDTIYQLVSVVNLTKAYCYVASNTTLPVGPAYTFLQTPDSIGSIANQSSDNFVEGGAWGLGNKWYGTVYSDKTFITIDTVTGARTVIGNMGVDMNGLAFDYTTHKFFGVSWNGTSSSLYTISPSTGAATLIGNSTVSDLLINLACDTLGNLYSLGTTNDLFYSVNKYTGVATALGAIGFEAEYAQGMGCEHSTNTIYLAGYDESSSAGDLSFVNTTTGASTEVGEFEDGAEITGFAIPYNAPIPSFDASVSAYSSPASACGLGLDSITITIDNLGSSAISHFPVSYSINGGTAVTDTIMASIAAGTSLIYTFPQQANLSDTGTYIIKAYSSLSGDAFPGNDTLTFTVKNISVSDPPYSMGFEPTEDYSAWKIIDANGDGFTWNIESTGGNFGPYCAEYSHNTGGTVAADDWLITKCIDFQAGTNYDVSYYYEVGSASDPESFAVYLGTAQTVAGMTTQLISEPNDTNTVYNQGVVNFTVPSSGTYYIGFLCNSAANEWNLYLDDINISISTSIHEKTVNNNISVYPNPAKDLLNIISGENISNIKLFNEYGQLVMNSTVNGTSDIISTSALAEGVYYLRVETKKGVSTQKVVIQK
jgi:hypothetical protein